MSLQDAEFKANVYESSGTIKLGNKQIPYKTVSQDNVLHDESGQAIGSMFTYSYFRTDVTDLANRPVMFFFNGGPGSGSLWLHAGLFGPLRIRFENPDAVNTPHIPPYIIEENKWCMIDICDLVFIDPVGTGWGRLLNKDSTERFYGMDEDAESFKVFIHMWLNRYNRWLSPKYMLGESYGTVRAALLSDKLTGKGKDMSAVALNGIVMLGSAIGNTEAMLKFDAEPALLALPSMAATNWYHNKMPGTLKEFVDSCYAFCEKDYLLALFKGSDLDEAEAERIAERVSYFTGLSITEVKKQDLRPNMPLYWKQLLESDGLELGRLDSRFTLPFGTRTGEEGVALTQYTPAFMAAMCGPIKESLKITHEREYYAISGFDKVEWKRTSEKPAFECLAASMRRNSELRVLFATGYYDMACQIGQAKYLASRECYPKERIDVKEYPSGHMLYLGEDSAKTFADDVRAFIN
jgi:carboxypeptidase C (cathepsin A)